MRLLISNSEGHILSIPFDANEEKILFSHFSKDICDFAKGCDGKLYFLIMNDGKFAVHKGTILVNSTHGQKPFRIDYDY